MRVGNAGPKVGIVVPVHKEGQQLYVFEMKLAGEANAIKRFIAQADQRNPLRGLVKRGPLTHIGVSLKFLVTPASQIESLGEGHITVIAPVTVRIVPR